MGGTRPADRPASAGRWGRQASTDHSHEAVKERSMLSSSPSKIHEPRVTGVSPRPTTSDSARKMRNTRSLFTEPPYGTYPLAAPRSLLGAMSGLWRTAQSWHDRRLRGPAKASIGEGDHGSS